MMVVNFSRTARWSWLPSRARRALRGLALVFAVGLVVAACGGSSATAGRDAAVDRQPKLDGFNDLTSDLGSTQTDGSHLPLPAACGGTVQVTGTTPYGSFSAQYVDVSLTPCGGELDIVIAQSDISDSARLDFRLIPQSTTHLGTSMVAAMYAPPGGAGTTQSVPAQVTITAFTPTLVMDQDGGRDPVTGS